MPKQVYRCSECGWGGRPEDRELLTVKKVYFNEMGMGGRTLKSRVVGWLCPDCVTKDTDFNRPAFQPSVAAHG